MARPPQDTLLLFTPHVPRRVQAGGWSPERQRCFIAALARTGVVRAAAASVGMSASSAYQLRARVLQQTHNLADVPMSPETAAALGPGYVFSFAAAWDVALGEGLDLQIDAALPVALKGERVPVIRRGAIVGWRTKFNMRLAIAALGAFRRSYEGQWYDYEVRTARHTAYFAEKIEALLRLGPVRWPDPPEPESREARLARKRAERAERRRYGPRVHGLLDPCGPADQPPRRIDLPPPPSLPPREHAQ
ncbi:MAG: hypothetical protein V4574_14955 [Pseudomonadota bacterium]